MPLPLVVKKGRKMLAKCLRRDAASGIADGHGGGVIL